MAKRGSQFQPGESGNPAGRPKGSKNRYTKMKEAFVDAFEELGGVDGLVEWAKESTRNRESFYQMVVRLLPRDVNLDMGDDIPCVIRAPAVCASAEQWERDCARMDKAQEAWRASRLSRRSESGG